MRQPTLAVIGEQHRIEFRQTPLEFRQFGKQGIARRRSLKIDPQQLLLPTDDTQFDCRADRRIDVQRGFDPLLVHQAFELHARLIAANQRQQGNSCAQCRRVARHVGRTARPLLATLDLDHRHRRFRRNA